MLYVIQNGHNGVTSYHPSALVYCIVRFSDILEQDVDCMFTDGHAFSAITKYYSKEDLNRIDEIIKREDVYAKFWRVEDDLDLKRRKEAELLIKTELPVKYIRGFVVYNNEARDMLLGYGIDASMIVVKESFYF
jgi:DNA topoisomerase VI subunit A